METCRMCGARLNDSEEVRHHNTEMHPNMVGKKGGEPEQPPEVEKDVPKPDRDRPID